MGSNFRGGAMWICYKLVDINFCGCLILCVLLYLSKYIASYGNCTIFFGYQRPPYIQGSMGTRFTVWNGKQQYIRPCFAVFIMNDGKIVGHVQRAACALF